LEELMELLDPIWVNGEAADGQPAWLELRPRSGGPARTVVMLRGKALEDPSREGSGGGQAGLGVVLDDQDPRGATVRSVTEGGAAWLASAGGVETTRSVGAGDVITRVSGEPLAGKRGAELYEALAGAAFERVALEVLEPAADAGAGAGADAGAGARGHRRVDLVRAPRLSRAVLAAALAARERAAALPQVPPRSRTGRRDRAAAAVPERPVPLVGGALSVEEAAAAFLQRVAARSAPALDDASLAAAARRARGACPREEANEAGGGGDGGARRGGDKGGEGDAPRPPFSDGEAADERSEALSEAQLVAALGLEAPEPRWIAAALCATLLASRMAVLPRQLPSPNPSLHASQSDDRQCVFRFLDAAACRWSLS